MYEFNNEIVQAIWSTANSNEEILSMFETVFTDPVTWERTNNRAWLVYLSCLIENDDNKMAEKVLGEYCKFYGLKDIEKYLLVSKFCDKMAINNLEIKKSAEIYDGFNNNYLLDSLYNKLKFKSIALVGNSPCEINSNVGKEIDEHDIVIRMNKFIKNINDYGEKCNIYALSGNQNFYKNGIGNDVIIVEDYLHMAFNWDEYRNDIYNVIKNENIEVSTIPTSIFKNIKTKYPLLNLDIGKILIWILLVEFKFAIDCYGMTSIQKLKENGITNPVSQNKYCDKKIFAGEEGYIYSIINKKVD